MTMPLYTISYTVTGEGWTVVEAESEEAARALFDADDWEADAEAFEHTVTKIAELTQ
jgi:hypothetical protein